MSDVLIHLGLLFSISVTVIWFTVRMKTIKAEYDEMLYHYSEFKINTQERIYELEKKVSELSQKQLVESKEIEDLEKNQLLKYTRLAIIELLKHQVGGDQ